MQDGKTGITDCNGLAITGNEELPPDEYASPEALLRHIATRVDELARRLDHADVMAHEIDQKVTALTATLDLYRPLLDRFADPGAAVRGFLTGHKKGGK